MTRPPCGSPESEVVVSENTIGAPPGQWYLTADELAELHRFVEVRVT